MPGDPCAAAGERPAHLDDEHPVLSALPARERLLAAAWLAGYRSARTRDAPPLRCAAGYVRPRQARPLRAAAAVGAGGGAPRPMLDDIPRRRTPAGRRRSGDGATRHRARSALCRVVARLTADLPVRRRLLLAPVPAGVQLGVPGRTAAGGRQQRAHGPRHHAHHGAAMLANDPGRHSTAGSPQLPQPDDTSPGWSSPASELAQPSLHEPDNGIMQDRCLQTRGPGEALPPQPRPAAWPHRRVS